MREYRNLVVLDWKIKIDKCREDLSNDLSFDLISPALIQMRIISSDEYAKIRLGKKSRLCLLKRSRWNKNYRSSEKKWTFNIIWQKKKTTMKCIKSDFNKLNFYLIILLKPAKCLIKIVYWILPSLPKYLNNTSLILQN